jgi:molybdopterin-containing oxidoreductase family membrane subunit
MESVIPIQLAPPPPELARVPLVADRGGVGWLADTIAAITEGKTPRWWWVAFTLSFLALCLGVAMVLYLVSTGVGVWGVSHPVMWGWAIVNFVWWIGIGHAGTLISAILLLLRQRWRTAVNRAAEAMTIFAVMCATIFPVLHVGRVWFAWWLLPIPTANGLWPQFHSPLMWDVFAIGTYFTVSVLFWYMGLLPDLAVMRDRARNKVRKLCYGWFALGWTGSHRHWHHYQKAYLILAGLCTPLVLSVHSIVSLDFSAAQLPGWHSTIFPPYFVAGAIFSGLAMVLTLVVPLRKLCRLEDVITVRHVEVMCKATLAMSALVGYAYLMELFIAWYSGNPYESGALRQRAFGPYWWAYWIMIVCNVVAPQAFWFKRVRTRMAVVFVVALLVNAGMWLERFVIVVGSLSRDFLPANWSYYTPTWVDVCTFAGSFGLFFTLFLLCLRFLPMVAIAEVKSVAAHGSSFASHAREDAAPADDGKVGVAATASSAPYGLLAEFDSPAAVLRAAEKSRGQGLQRWDVFTPYPVPGLDRAMGLRNSSVGGFALVGSALGFLAGMAMVWFMNQRDYPIPIGGKPLFSPFSALPTAFETMILLGAFGTLFGMLWFNRLPRWHHPLLKHRRFALATRDRFFLLIECGDPKYEEAQARKLLASLGSRRIELVEV